MTYVFNMWNTYVLTEIKTQKNTNMEKSIQKHKINSQKDTQKST